MPPLGDVRKVGFGLSRPPGGGGLSVPSSLVNAPAYSPTGPMPSPGEVKPSAVEFEAMEWAIELLR